MDRLEILSFSIKKTQERCKYPTPPDFWHIQGRVVARRKTATSKR
jgi:hypothetical protein